MPKHGTARHSPFPTPTRKTDLNVDILLTLLAGFSGRSWGLAGSEPVHARRTKPQNPLYSSVFQREISGRGGIRTHGWFNPTLDFESSALNRTQPPFLLWVLCPQLCARQGKVDGAQCDHSLDRQESDARGNRCGRVPAAEDRRHQAEYRGILGSRHQTRPA